MTASLMFRLSSVMLCDRYHIHNPVWPGDYIYTKEEILNIPSDRFMGKVGYVD